jgi:O-antigen ligase
MIFNSQIEKIAYFKIPIILFCLLPFFLITGPLLSDLSVSIINILFLTYCFKKKNFSYFKKNYFYIFLIFWAYLVFNSLINNFNLDSLKISIFYFRYGVFVIAISALLDFDERFIKYFFYVIFICFVSLIIDGYYQYFVGENILGFKTPNSMRVSSFFGDEQILGSYLSRIWPLLFGLSIFFSNKNDKLFYVLVLIFIMSETLIFLSGDRSSFFYINLSAVFVILFSQKLFRLRLITLLSSLLLIIIITYFYPVAKMRIVDHTLHQMNLTSTEKNKEDKIYIFSKTHHAIFTSSYKMFLDNKIVGVGVKNFRNLCDEPKYKSPQKNSCTTHPHNTYLQILTETGIIGFLFLIFTLIYFCFHVIRHAVFKIKGKKYFNDFEICLLSGLAIYLMPFVPTGNVFNNWVNITMILYFPFLIWSKKKHKF